MLSPIDNILSVINNISNTTFIKTFLQLSIQLSANRDMYIRELSSNSSLKRKINIENMQNKHGAIILNLIYISK